MAAHRFWALLVKARPAAGAGVSVAEVEMRATAGGADQCAGGTASGTSSLGHVAANAFDNSNASFWYNGATGGQAARLSYEFSSAVNVVEVWVRLPGAAAAYPGATYGPAACQLQWSDDGTVWAHALGAADLSALGNDGEATLGPVSDAPPQTRLLDGLARLVGYMPPGQPTTRLSVAALRYDPVDGGTYSITSDVAISGTPDEPVQRQVLLFEATSMRLVRSTWSDPVTGAYAFPNLKLQTYLALSRDITGYYNAAVADRLTPV